MSLPSTQKQVHLLNRPGRGDNPLPERVLGVVDAPVPKEADMKQGCVLVKVLFVSLDPSMRPSMDLNLKSYRPPAPTNAVFWAGGVGLIMHSTHPDFEKGDKVLSSAMGAQEYAVFDVEAAKREGYFHKVDPAAGIEEREYLGGLWGTGMAAYLGVCEVGQVKSGHRVLVSGAAGATGGLAIQIARLRGAVEVIGIAGGAEKAKYVVEELGADACIDYRSEDYLRQIAKLSDREVGGIDVYFDNVGGATLDAALAAMNPGGTIVCCGAIAAYSGDSPGLKNATSIVSRRLRLQGYIAFQSFWPKETWSAAVAQLATWLKEGKISTRFYVYDQVGVVHFREALNALFAGKNQGKMLLQVDGEWQGKGSRTARL